MIYRKSPPTPPRLLLRVVAVAGTGALLTMGCSGSHAHGLSPESPSDASDTDVETILMGSTGNPPPPDDGSFTGFVCLADSACNVAPYDPDAGDGGDADGHILQGAVHYPDAGDAAPDASSDAPDEATGVCHPCGVVIRPDE